MVLTPVGGGRIEVGSNIVIDSTSETIEVGTGITINGAIDTIEIAAGGKIVVDDMEIDPASGGSVTFPGGAVMRGGSGGGVEMVHGSYEVVVTSAGASDWASEMINAIASWMRGDLTEVNVRATLARDANR